MLPIKSHLYFPTLGMVTDAQWYDMDGDGKKELIVVGDWMPVTILKYENGLLNKTGELTGSSGWWNCLTIADVNGDGLPGSYSGKQWYKFKDQG